MIFKEKKIYIYIIIIGFLFSSCEKKYETKYYNTGEIKSKIYYNNKLDTNYVEHFSKNGDIISKTFCYPNNVYVIDILKDTGNTLKYSCVIVDNTSESIINRGELIFKNNKNYGIHRLYNDNDFKYNQELFFNDNRLVAFTSYKREDTTEYFYKFQRRVQDNGNIGVNESVLVYNKNNKLIKSKSFGYIVEGNDTILYGNNYTFNIEYITDKFDIDTVLCGLDIGTLDSDFNVINITHSKGGYKKNIILL